MFGEVFVLVGYIHISMGGEMCVLLEGMVREEHVLKRRVSLVYVLCVLILMDILVGWCMMDECMMASLFF